jgi:hypothetical protein
MIVLVHAPILCVLMALQFHAAGLDKPPALWRTFSRILMAVALIAVPLCFYAGGVVGTRAGIASIIVAAAGFAGYRRIDEATRYFRWLSLGSWCLCILATMAMIGWMIIGRLLQ